MKTTLAALSCVLVLGASAVPLVASAHERTFSVTYDHGSYPRPSTYSSSSRSSYSTEGRIRYDSSGNAYWDNGTGSRSSRDTYDYRDDRYNQDRYDRTYGTGTSYSCSGSTNGRIRYDSHGIAYWDSGSASCR